MKHGPDLEEMGGTKIDRVDSEWLRTKNDVLRLTMGFVAEPSKNFLDHYLEEIKEQFRSPRK